MIAKCRLCDGIGKIRKYIFDDISISAMYEHIPKCIKYHVNVEDCKLCNGKGYWICTPEEPLLYHIKRFELYKILENLEDEE